MTLVEYYKREIYSQGYWDGQQGKNNGVGTIFYEDEMDYCICQAYYGQYVGDMNGWTDEEIQFLEMLGFAPEDFEDPDDEEDE